MKQANHSGCKFTAEMAAYMYDELSSDDCAAFELHLLECSECTDEFAGLSNARYEVYDWKKIAFDPLPTPRFTIPHPSTTSIASWTESVKAFFGRSWSIPVLALSSLAVIVFVGFQMGHGTDSNEVADRSSDATSSLARNTRPSNVVVSEPDLSVVTDDREVAASSGKGPVAAQTNRKRVSPKIATDSLDPVRKTKPESPVRAIREQARQTSAAIDLKTVPTLNEYVDDEDNSLRLAELFEDVDSK